MVTVCGPLVLRPVHQFLSAKSEWFVEDHVVAQLELPAELNNQSTRKG